MNKKAASLPGKTNESESLIWVFKDQKWAGKENGGTLLKLEIPEEEIIFFDLRKWNKVLNLSYIGDEEQEKQFAEELKRMGIRDPLEVFSKPFYPLQKKKVVDSWETLFSLAGVEEQYVQGGIWKMKEEWIREITP